MAIESFDGENRFLSNFWPTRVTLDNIAYPSVENAYQAAKTLDLAARKPFETCTAAEAKKLGRTLVMRSDWNDVKLHVMARLLVQKFEHAELANKLMDTDGEELIEGNWWGDTYWGVCRGKGENYLGKLLMKIRDNLLLGGER